MNAPQPLSPIHDALIAGQAVWRQGQAQASEVSHFSAADATKAARLGVADLSYLARAGVKGAGAAEWLAAQGLPLPDAPNRWTTLDDGGLIARLGTTEYLIEASPAVIERLQNTPRTAKVYPVLRQDAAFALCGEHLDALLLQVCNVDFRCLERDPGQVVLTSMAGVGVTVLRSGIGDKRLYRLWCDGTYGLYLWETLCAIAEEFGGGCIGLDVLP